jgi:copper oxidase (laccase) domain-containing protein
MARIQELGGKASQVRAAIGPAIGVCCFQTGGEVVSGVEALLQGDTQGLYHPDGQAAGKFRVNLPQTVKRRLIQLGVSENNIDDLGVCTMCHPESFWSHRLLGADRGSQANLIML